MAQKKIKTYLAVDLGGTNTKFGVGTAQGKLLKASSVESEIQQGPSAWIARIETIVRSWNMPFDAIGVGSPGPLDSENGIILTTPNLGAFEGFNLKSAFIKAFGKPVYFENDANCGALAEYVFGTHKGTPHLVVITLGTGVGSGVIVNGQLLRGAGGFACELGHMIINLNAAENRVFEDGSFEGFVGSRKTVERFAEMSGKNPVHTNMASLFKAAIAGRAEESKFVNDWIYALAIGLANTCVIFNPQKILVAGGVTASWDYIHPKLMHFLRDLVPTPILKSVIVEVSDLGEYFGVYGALALALQQNGDNG